MMSEYILGDGFEGGGDGGYSSNGGSGGSGCLVMIAAMGGLFTTGLFGLLLLFVVQ